MSVTLKGAAAPKPSSAKKDIKVDESTPIDRVVESNGQKFSEINELWKQAEGKLKRYNVPSECSVEVWADQDDRDPQSAVFWHLGWAKQSGSWQICYGCTGYWDGYTEADWKPILDCTLDVRIRCIQKLPDLRTAVEKKVRELNPELDGHVEKFHDILSNWA